MITLYWEKWVVYLFIYSFIYLFNSRTLLIMSLSTQQPYSPKQFDTYILNTELVTSIYINSLWVLCSINLFCSLNNISHWQSLYLYLDTLKVSKMQQFQALSYSFIRWKYPVFHKTKAELLSMSHNASISAPFFTSWLITHASAISARTLSLKCDFPRRLPGLCIFQFIFLGCHLVHPHTISPIYHVSPRKFFKSSKVRTCLFACLLDRARYIIHFVIFF